jgi:hypothetical protein
MHDQLFGLVEGNRLFGEQVQLLVRADCIEPRLDAIGVDRFRQFAFQPEHHRLVAAMSFTGGAERTVEIGPDARHPRQ